MLRDPQTVPHAAFEWSMMITLKSRRVAFRTAASRAVKSNTPGDGSIVSHRAATRYQVVLRALRSVKSPLKRPNVMGAILSRRGAASPCVTGITTHARVQTEATIRHDRRR